MSVIKVNENNFQEIVLDSEKPVLVDFFATWCGPCRMLAPTVHEIAEERSDIVVGKVNCDLSPELAVAFGVVSIPTLIVLKGGKAVAQSVGVRSKADILAMLENK